MEKERAYKKIITVILKELRGHFASMKQQRDAIKIFKTNIKSKYGNRKKTFSKIIRKLKKPQKSRTNDQREG